MWRMCRKLSTPCSALAVCALLVAGGFAGGSPPDDREGATVSPPSEEGSPAMHVVRREQITSEVSLDGVFTAPEAVEVAVAPEEWSQLEVVDVVEHGARVERGDVLLRFATREIDLAITDLERSVRSTTLSIEKGESELDYLQATLALDLESARRAAEDADADLLRFVKVERSLSEKSARARVENASNYLAYEREELEQLRKMYEADDLTEETEEIILERQKDTVARLEFSLETARIARDRVLEVELPRQEADLTEKSRRLTQAWEKAQEALPRAVESKRHELESSRADLKKSEEKLARLRRDREALEVSAPASGIVYYGRAVDGRWTTAAALRDRLRPGGKVQPREVLVTIVRPRPLELTLAVPEKDLDGVREATGVEVIPTAFPRLRLEAALARIAEVPLGDEFAAVVHPAMEEGDSALLPGMTCSITFEKLRDALTVPESAVIASTRGESRRRVRVVGSGGDVEEREVRVLPAGDGRLEVVEGLEEGDRVLLGESEAREALAAASADEESDDATGDERGVEGGEP